MHVHVYMYSVHMVESPDKGCLDKQVRIWLSQSPLCVHYTWTRTSMRRREFLGIPRVFKLSRTCISCPSSQGWARRREGGRKGERERDPVTYSFCVYMCVLFGCVMCVGSGFPFFSSSTTNLASVLYTHVYLHGHAGFLRS